MSANTNVGVVSVGPCSLAQLSDGELLTQTRSLVGRSNRMLAELLAHLGEVETRGIHRTRACSSLYTYCIYELRFSEDEAFRRVAAARLVKRHPALFDAIATGELHLTGLLMLGPHLTAENLVEVMARAKYRTKREIARLVRVLDPLPPVPARIEPLGPAQLVPPEPTWEQFVGSMNPVRELAAGERPRDWGFEDEQPASGERLKGEAFRAARRIVEELDPHAPARVEAAASGTHPAAFERDETPAATPTAAEPCGELSAPQRYKVQFTATEEYVRLVDEAKALLSHAAPRASLEEIQLRAMRAFVETLRKRKYGSNADGLAAAEHAPLSRVTDDDRSDSRVDESRKRNDTSAALADECVVPMDDAAGPSKSRWRGRHIPAAIRREVARRDGHRCTYSDATGRRCAETRRLEFHHVVPFALKASHDVSNLTLRCAAHNTLAAEHDFGRDLVRERRAARHEPFGTQGP